MAARASRQAFFTAVIALTVLLISAGLDERLAAINPTGLIANLAEFFSLLGNGALLIPITLILLGLGWRLGREKLRLAGRDSLYAVLLSGLVVQLLKAVFERPRLAHSSEYILHAITHPSFFDLTGRFNSFPSGHTATAFALAAVLGKYHPRIKIPLYLTALLIGASRLALGAHYLSDVTGGALLGLAVAWLLTGKWEISEKKKKWAIAGLTLLVISVCFFKLGGYLVFDVDEAVFSEASREMVVTGDLITPSYNFEPRYDKPILFYWAMSAAFKTFGVSEFAARFPSAAFGAGLVLITFLFVRRFRDFNAAVWASIVLLLNLEFFVYSHSAVTDMTLAFFITGALYSAYGGIKTGEKRLYLAFWICSALAMLTKGAIGLLFPLSISIIYLILRRDISSAKRLFNPLFIIVFFLITTPWFLLEYHARGWEFIDAFIIKHHIHRFTGVISSHGGPFYFYVLILLAGFFPWVGLLPQALLRGIKAVRGRAKKNDLLLFLSIWFFFIFIFFSISRTKLPNYIFPAIPACSVLVGLLISSAVKKGTRLRFSFILMAILSLILSAAAFILPYTGVKMEVTLPPYSFTILGLITLFTGIFALLCIKKPARFAPLIAAASVVFLVFLRLYAVPPVNAFMEQDLYEYAIYAKETKTSLATFEINQPSIAFYYASGKVIKLEGNAIEKLMASAESNTLIITKSSIAESLKKSQGLTIISKGAEFALLSLSPHYPAFRE